MTLSDLVLGVLSTSLGLQFVFQSIAFPLMLSVAEGAQESVEDGGRNTTLALEIGLSSAGPEIKPSLSARPRATRERRQGRPASHSGRVTNVKGVDAG